MLMPIALALMAYMAVRKICTVTYGRNLRKLFAKHMVLKDTHLPSSRLSRAPMHRAMRRMIKQGLVVPCNTGSYWKSEWSYVLTEAGNKLLTPGYEELMATPIPPRRPQVVAELLEAV